MSKIKIILITIFLGIILIIVFSFFVFNKTTPAQIGDTNGTNFFSKIFPFGKSKTNTSQDGKVTDVSGYIPTAESITAKEKLTKVSSMPIAGYGTFMKERYEVTAPVTPPTAPEDTTTNIPQKETKTTTVTTPPASPLTEFVPAVRYVERATGNVYQTLAEEINETKISTTVVPQVYEAYLGNNAETATLRYLGDDNQTIETFIDILPKEILGGDSTQPATIAGSFLPENVTTMSMSPDSSSIFYIYKSGNGVIGSTSLDSGDKKNQIFTSSFTEWLSAWPNDRMITITTKPSSQVPGYMYSIDPASKKMKKQLGGINGLTTLTSPNGKLILYGNNNLELRVYNVDASNSVLFGIKTLPEKCVWALDNINIYCAVPNFIDGINYPDSWYQGETTFSDQIWQINTENGNTTMLADPTQFEKGEDIDGIKLSLDNSGKYLFFVNKKDSALWELNLE